MIHILVNFPSFLCNLSHIVCVCVSYLQTQHATLYKYSHLVRSVPGFNCLVSNHDETTKNQKASHNYLMYNCFILQTTISPVKKVTLHGVCDCVTVCTQIPHFVNLKSIGIQKSSKSFCSISPTLGADFQSASG